MRARLLAAAAAAGLLLTLTACAGQTEPAASAPATTQTPAASGCTYAEAAGGVREVDAPPAEPTVSGEVSATLQTSAGELQLTLDADRTPCTVGSFVSLAEQGYFDGTTCHRLTTEGIFVLQCGDPSATGRGGPGYRYADELDGTETYPAGTLAMANAGPDTNGSQFFIVYEDTQLPAAYTVFGHVDESGVGVVRQVAAAGLADDGIAPATPVDITAVTIG
ncbi:peptidylprolyl isomerase [Microbacterium telephonicum]|uniref:Peptidyl-prolyl cis-trans isomerase n=1 Tax=Microbacterium telephonicum TaxID=1714841 RepID=A0A498C7V6_9MICO|nr:peptidylprolyl isomerase [Microbacterium telephonicum]RLK52244.1 peptidyl-prolyl cis-trans isomerase B (cyclophilin B) [Microbacterium telephonicum]